VVRMGLTDRQAHTLSAIVALMGKNRRTPSVREIMAAAGISSTSVVHGILCALKARGYVRWLPGKDRSLVLLPRASGAFVLPPELAAALDRFCGATGDDPAAIIADAVARRLDQRGAA
jgi:SOS-response transcriptional repressor LexA